MTLTFNGCYFSDIKVHPKNWKAVGASTKKDWYYYYRFYDPTILDEKGKIKPLLIVGKGMNRFHSLSDRRQQTDALIQREKEHMVHHGFNPITAQYMIDQDAELPGDIDPNTPFTEALYIALDKLSCGHRTKVGIRSVIKGVEKAAIQLRFDSYPICKISRKHIKKILERCEVVVKGWSDNRYNAYRAYLLMLYKELVEQEAVAGNPIRDISKRTAIQKIKTVLTDDERRRVDEHLQQVFPRFHLFVHLFFHSGGRKTELFQLKPGNVDLVNQKYKCIVKKRKKFTEVQRTIKEIAVPYWEAFLNDCPADKFIFGTRFLPGDKPMGVDMPSRYWNENVKAPISEGGLGIDVDLYSLKHLNTTELVTLLDEQAAAAMNAHQGTAMVRSVYDVRQKERQHDRLKGLKNKFA